MSNYQILEIALDVAFFATVASIAVIFVMLREKSLEKKMGADASLDFPEMLRETTAPVPEDSDLFSENSKDSNVKLHESADDAVTAFGRQIGLSELSRAERELILSVEGKRFEQSI